LNTLTVGQMEKATCEQFASLAITDVSVSIVFDAMLPSLSQMLAKKLGANGATLH